MDSSLEKTSNRQIKIGSVLSYAAIILEIVAGLLFIPWMTKIIGQSNYAIYTLANSLVSALLLDFGLGTAVTRFLSKYLASNEKEKISNFLGIVFKVYFVLDAIIAIALLVILFVYPSFANGIKDDIYSFRISFAIVASYSVLSFPFTCLNSILTANEKFAALKTFGIVSKLLSIGSMALALLLGFGLFGIVASSAISQLLILIIKLVFLLKHKLFSVKMNYKNPSLFKELFGFSLWATLIVIAQRLTYNFVPSVLGVVSNKKEIAIFGFAMTLETYAYSIANAINGLFIPKISRIMISENPQRGLNSLFFKVGKAQLLIIGLIFCGFIFCGREFILLVMGKEYELSYICGILLILPKLLIIPKQIASSTCYLTSNIKYEALIQLLFSIIGIIMAALLGKFFGSIGASLSVCVAFVFIMVFLDVFIYWKKMKFEIFRFYLKGFCKYLLISTPITFIFWIVKIIIPIDRITILLMYILSFSFTYLFLMWIFFFNREDKASILNFLSLKRIRLFKKEFLINGSLISKALSSFTAISLSLLLILSGFYYGRLAVEHKAINSIDDLKLIEEDPSGYYELRTYLTIPSDWKPICDKDNPFTGIFVGKNFTISMNETYYTNNNFGIFDTNKGTILGLTITLGAGSTIECGENCESVGIICSDNYGYVTSCSVNKGTIVVNNNSATNNSIGILCGNNYGNIKRCTIQSHLNVFTVAQCSVGNMCGNNSPLSDNNYIDQSIVSSSVLTIKKTNNVDHFNCFVGRIAGVSAGGLFSDCFVLGTIRGDDELFAYCGGLVGKMVMKNSIFKSCYSKVSIELKNGVFGGFIGSVDDSCRVRFNNLLSNTKIMNADYTGSFYCNNCSNKDIQNCYSVNPYNLVCDGISISSPNDLSLKQLSWNRNLWKKIEGDFYFEIPKNT